MCGIGGILFSHDPPAALEARLAQLRTALLPRGPDGAGLTLDVAARSGLVHTRLALVDLAGGAQPMVDASGRYTLVFNGELYNHRELRAELVRDYPFRTQSDTETLLAAYVVWGEACLDQLNGMFAFAVWDAHTRSAFFARDALGVKPLVFARSDDGELVFASEAKAILAQRNTRPRLDRDALVEYLLAPALSGVRSPMFEGLEHLHAGECLRVTANDLSRRRWFHYRVGADEPACATALADELRTALAAAVARTRVADVPVGVFLSGGLDSTAIALLALRAQPASEPPLAAFTIRFEAHGDIDFGASSIVISDDAPFVETLAATLPIELTRVTAREGELVPALAELARIDDRIPAWEQELSQHFLARAAAGRRKAVLVGDAADETHFGYFFLLDEHAAPGVTGFLERFGASARAQLLNRDLREALRPVEKLTAEYTALCTHAGYSFETPAERVRALTHLIVERWLARLLHNGDVHTMAHGLEVRVPFADRQLLAVAARVPPSLGYADGVEKHLLRQAMRPVVPDAIYRRKKSVLPRDPRLAPLYQRALTGELREQAGFAREWLDLPAVERLCALPAPTDGERMLLFNLLALFLFHRRYHG